MSDGNRVREYANEIVDILDDDEEEIAVFLAGVALALVSLFSSMADGDEEELEEYCQVFYNTLMVLAQKDDD